MVERSVKTNHATADQSLRNLVTGQLRSTGSTGACTLAEDIREQFGAGVVGIIYYGSCFRTGSDEDGIIDLLILVNKYRNIYPRRRLLTVANALLPPNIFYLQKDVRGRTVRTKYAVISLRDFALRTSRKCFHTYFWARFAQPCTLLYASDPRVREAVITAIVAAIETFIERVVPTLPERFDTATLWAQGLLGSYRTELRPERPEAAALLVDADMEWYRLVTAAAQREFTFFNLQSGNGDEVFYSANASRRQRWLNHQAWQVRRVQGKFLNVLRILKAAFTFDGGADYVLWKIERHSGIRVEATPMLRRHPLLACWGTVWRLYRRGAFR